MAVADNALCTFEDVLLFKDNHESVADNDTLIEELINEKTAQFHKYMGREQLLSKEYTEYHDGGNSQYLFPLVRPVISVSSIHDDCDFEWGVDTLIYSGDYMIVDDLIMLKDDVFDSYMRNVKIVYTAGYATVPEDVKLACIKEVIREFNRRYDFDVSSISQDDGSVSYVEKGLLKSTKEVLDTYKLIGISG